MATREWCKCEEPMRVGRWSDTYIGLFITLPPIRHLHDKCGICGWLVLELDARWRK